MNSSKENESFSEQNSMYLLVGTYTTSESDGIYVYQFDTINGFSKYKSVAKVENPSYLAVSNNEQYVYAVSELGDNKGAANAFSFDKKEGTLSLINSELTGGDDPCYIAVDKTGNHVITANYSGGSITLFDVNEKGALSIAKEVISFMGSGQNAQRQKQPHLHSVIFSPDGNYLFAADLGTDKIHKFNVSMASDSNYISMGTPPAFAVDKGSGPRHMEFHPNGKYLYLINELSGTVNVFVYNKENGDINDVQNVLADTLRAGGSADIHLSPNGKFLYASNRLEGDGIAIFSVNQLDGTLTKVGYQETAVHPRNFAISPNGKFLLVASRDDNLIQIFRINQNTGLLENEYKDIKVSMPVCLKFLSLE